MKSHSEIEAGKSLPETIDRKHLIRWAHQSLPVFLVVVTGRGPNPRFFVRSIDDYLQHVPKALDPSAAQKTFAVTVHECADLSSQIRKDVDAFYEASARNLARLDPVEVENNHIEFLSEENDKYPHAEARLDFWKAVYKSPARPRNFRAVVDYVFGRVKSRWGGARPSQTTCFLYRSVSCLNSNQYLARITYTEIGHPASSGLFKGVKSIQIDNGPTTRASRAYIASLRVSADEYEKIVRPLVVRADKLTQVQISADVEQCWPAPSVCELRSIESLLEKAPLPPSQLYYVDKFFRSHVRSLELFRWTVQDPIDATETTRARWQEQERNKLVGYLGASILLLEQALSSN